MNEIIVVEEERCRQCRKAQADIGIVSRRGGDADPIPIHVKVNDSTCFCIRLVVESDVVPCVEACPADALRRDKSTGAVSWRQEACIGCRLCVRACPYGAIRIEQTGN